MLLSCLLNFDCPLAVQTQTRVDYQPRCWPQAWCTVPLGLLHPASFFFPLLLNVYETAALHCCNAAACPEALAMSVWEEWGKNKVRIEKSEKREKTGKEEKKGGETVCVLCSRAWDAPSLDVCVWLHWADLGNHDCCWKATQGQRTGATSCCSTHDRNVHCFVLSNALNIQHMFRFQVLVSWLHWWVLKTGNVTWVTDWLWRVLVDPTLNPVLMNSQKLGYLRVGQLEFR